MQAYIDAHVDPKYVRATFTQGGSSFDCVDFDKQPGCQKDGCGQAPTPTSPSPAPSPSSSASGARLPTVMATTGPVQCPQGTVAVRRLTLREMAQFETLELFLVGNKGPAPPAP